MTSGAESLFIRFEEDLKIVPFAPIFPAFTTKMKNSVREER